MPFGEHKAVALGPAGIGGVKLHFFKEQNSHDIRDRHAGAGMPVACIMNRFHHVQTKTVGDAGEFINSHWGCTSKYFNILCRMFKF